MSKDKTLKTRLKIGTRGIIDVETYVLGQIKVGLFYKTIVSLPVTYSRDVIETKKIVVERLQKFVTAGFNSEGVIEL